MSHQQENLKSNTKPPKTVLKNSSSKKKKQSKKYKKTNEIKSHLDSSAPKNKSLVNIFN
jgi:hypothetical protein